ncbi:hypothetical protein BDV95DRAFT_635732 [Massariosphaeria phaeospora]|uniref:Uncharacterized protein n=1 Tax=Massariosphaeria phaeospora TaxID=100035 RepID=A0A7C8IAA5_9PLEO|nr:hypothetical protein BDV95DRAFT_635732 [Massariosphaeria phaeospora]
MVVCSAVVTRSGRYDGLGSSNQNKSRQSTSFNQPLFIFQPPTLSVKLISNMCSAQKGKYSILSRKHEARRREEGYTGLIATRTNMWLCYMCQKVVSKDESRAHDIMSFGYITMRSRKSLLAMIKSNHLLNKPFYLEMYAPAPNKTQEHRIDVDQARAYFMNPPQAFECMNKLEGNGCHYNRLGRDDWDPIANQRLVFNNWKKIQVTEAELNANLKSLVPELDHIYYLGWECPSCSIPSAYIRKCLLQDINNKGKDDAVYQHWKESRTKSLANRHLEGYSYSPKTWDRRYAWLNSFKGDLRCSNPQIPVVGTNGWFLQSTRCVYTYGQPMKFPEDPKTEENKFTKSSTLWGPTPDEYSDP